MLTGIEDTSEDLTGKGKEILRGEIALLTKRKEIYST